jgi:beta-phosphoglucomutase
VIRAVLLEVEGVLVESAEARRRSLAEALAARRHPADARAIDPTLPVREAARVALAAAGAPADETELDLLVREAGRRFTGWLGKGATLAPGARTFIERLHGRVRLGIVSRATRSEVEAMLSLAGLGDLFEFVLGEEDAWPPRPDPASHRAAIARLGRRGAISGEDVVALEDGAVGIAAARAAGLRCVAVGAVPAHVAMQADALLPSLDDAGAVDLVDALSNDREERR